MSDLSSLLARALARSLARAGPSYSTHPPPPRAPQGVAELLLDDNATASLPRPGTSFNRPATGQRGQGFDQSIRPVICAVFTCLSSG